MISERYRLLDGTTRQAGMHDVPSFRENAAFNLTFPIEAVVIDIHYPSDENNMSKAGIEYDLATELEGLPYLLNVPVAQGFGYYGDGTETILKKATKPAKAGQSGFNDESKCSWAETDGDRVLVAFIQASWLKPVIVARLPHKLNPIRAAVPEKPAATLKAKDLDPGKCGYSAVVNGTKVSVDDSGNVNIQLGEHQGDAAVADKKKITITKKDGTTPILTIDNTSGVKLSFGNGADQEMVLGTNIKQVIDAIISYLGTLQTGINSIATGTIANSFEETNPLLPEYLSDWIKSKKSAP